MADEDTRSQKERIESDVPPSPADDDRVGATPVIEAPALNTGLDTSAVATGPETSTAETPVVETPKGDTPEESLGKAPETAPIMDIAQEGKEEDKSPVNEVQQPKSEPVDLDAEDAKPSNAAPKPSMSDEEMEASFNSRHMPLINEIWGTDRVDPQLMEAMGQSGDIRKSKFGLEFVLPNGHKLEWHQNLGGAEFIGMSKRSADFDMDDAHATIAASKSRGWSAINVHGSKEEKEMLWLEAQRQGMEVTNFVPMADSEVRRIWEQEQQQKLDDLPLAGASPASHYMNPDLAAKELKELDSDASPPPTPPANEAETPKDPEADGDEVKPPASKHLNPKPDDTASTADVDTAGKEVKAEAELPAGSITFQQFLEREMVDPTNSPEMMRGYMEMQAAMVEGKIDPSDVDAIQLGRNQGMGGNAMREKMDSTLTAAQYNDLASGFETAMREKGGEPDFKVTRAIVSDEPSSPALDTSALKDAAPIVPKQRVDVPKV